MVEDGRLKLFQHPPQRHLYSEYQDSLHVGTASGDRGLESIQLWFDGMGGVGTSGWDLHTLVRRWSPARFHWPFHQALENSLMAHRTPQDMPLDAPLEISQVTRGALIDLGYQVEGISIP